MCGIFTSVYLTCLFVFRYQRGSRSLADNLVLTQTGKDANVTDEEQGEEYDIPEEIEEVIGQYIT